MNIQEELRINGHQPVCGTAGTDQGDFYEALIEKCKSHGWNPANNLYFLMDCAFSYGVIQGKRAERARRKKTA